MVGGIDGLLDAIALQTVKDYTQCLRRGLLYKPGNIYGENAKKVYIESCVHIISTVTNQESVMSWQYNWEYIFKLLDNKYYIRASKNYTEFVHPWDVVFNKAAVPK